MPSASSSGLWGFTKVRYRGLAKSLARAQNMFALANLYQVRHQLLAAGDDVLPENPRNLR
jgi:IS5 family transposase